MVFSAALVLTAPATLSSACSSGEPAKKAGEGPNAELRRRTLESLAANVVLPLYRDFEAAARALKSAADAHAAAPGPDTRTAARNAWIEAAEIWQQAELTQFGPAAMSSSVGGQELRARIYSWPRTNPCRVDQATLAKEYENPSLLDAQPTMIGLDALEYVLFVEDSGNSCAPNLAINTSGEWAALSAEPNELEGRRSRYAAAVAGILERDATALRTAWDPEGGNFFASFAGAGSGSPYATSQDALNAVGEALLYLDRETKDMKLAEPAGLMNCAAATCPQELESQWARQSRSHVVSNLRGFQRLYLGGDPGGSEFGLDDLLTELGAGELNQAMTKEIDEAIAVVKAIEDPSLFEALTADVGRVRDAFTAVKDVTDLFKTQVTSVLDLEPPNGAPADND